MRVSFVILMNDDSRIAKIKHGDMTIQHAFHHLPGGEPFIKRISSLNLKMDDNTKLDKIFQMHLEKAWYRLRWRLGMHDQTAKLEI